VFIAKALVEISSAKSVGRLWDFSPHMQELNSAVPLLIKACGYTNAAVRISVVTTLKSIDPEAAAEIK